MKTLTVKQIAESLAINPESKLDKQSLLNYLEENERMVKNEIKYGRSPKKYEKFVAAAKLGLSWLK